MARSQNGRVAVITGAALGIGQAYAKRLAEDGADIVIADLQAADETVALVKAAGRNALAVRCDISEPTGVAELAKETQARFGRCDILVNNAGIYPVQNFDDITFEDWRKVMAVNLDSQFLTIKAFWPGMRERKWGRIVNQASDTFLLNLPGFAHYIASKGGIIGFTRALASEFGEYNVTVNAIAPGLTFTPGTSWRAGKPGRDGNMDDFAMSASHQAVKHKLVPEDMVGTLSFLASDDAALVTGQTIYVDGGHVRV
jgi:NAD(P)-dependent dehydrogenase (short-subunit alcohol dehydrogenase family)